MMNCDHVKNKLERYLDNELSDQEAAAVSAHLANCPRCARELELLTAINGIGRMQSFPDPPQHYWAELHQNIRQKIRRQKRAPSRLAEFRDWLTQHSRQVRFSYRLAGLAATGIILFFIVRLSFFHHGRFEMPKKIDIQDAVPMEQALPQAPAAGNEVLSVRPEKAKPAPPAPETPAVTTKESRISQPAPASDLASEVDIRESQPELVAGIRKPRMTLSERQPEPGPADAASTDEAAITTTAKQPTREKSQRNINRMINCMCRKLMRKTNLSVAARFYRIPLLSTIIEPLPRLKRKRNL